MKKIVINNNKFNKYEQFKIRQATAAIAENIGFTTASSSAISSLSFLLRTYFEQLCIDSANIAINAGRNEVALEDVSRVFDMNDVNLTQLHEYLNQVTSFAPTEELPIFPITEFISGSSTDVVADISDRKETETAKEIENDDENKISRQLNGKPSLQHSSSSRSNARSATGQRNFPNFAGSIASQLGFNVRRVEPPVENVLIEQQLSKTAQSAGAEFVIPRQDSAVAEPITIKAAVGDDEERSLKKKKKKEKREKERSSAGEHREKEGKRKKHKDRHSSAEVADIPHDTTEGQHRQEPISPPQGLKIKIKIGPGPETPAVAAPAIPEPERPSPPEIPQRERRADTLSPPKEEAKVPPLKLFGLKPTMVKAHQQPHQENIDLIQQKIDAPTEETRKPSTVDGIAESLLQKQKETNPVEISPPIEQVIVPQISSTTTTTAKSTEEIAEKKKRVRRRKSSPKKKAPIVERHENEVEVPISRGIEGVSKPPTPKVVIPSPSPTVRYSPLPPPRPPSSSMASVNLLEGQTNVANRVMTPIPTKKAAAALPAPPKMKSIASSGGKSVVPPKKKAPEFKPRAPPSKKPKLLPTQQTATDEKVRAIAAAVEAIAAANAGRDRADQRSMAAAGEEEGEEEDIWICPVCSVAYVEGQDMVACDDCDRWFHWSCVGILIPPPENAQWYCTECRRKRKKLQHQPNSAASGTASGSSSRKSSISTPQSAAKKRRPSKT